MHTTILRYKVKPDRVDENRALIRRVFEEIESNKPEGLRYVAFNLADDVSFVHVAVVESTVDDNPLQQVAAFRDFTDNITDRCEEVPVAATAEIVGSYRLFWQKFSYSA